MENTTTIHPLVTIKPDGVIEYSPDYTPDAAAKIFWEALGNSMPEDRKRVGELTEELAAAKAEISRLTENQRLQDSATAAVMERAETAEAEIAALREDAERYRWLRELPNADAMNVKFCGCDLDTVIDAARKEGA